MLFRFLALPLGMGVAVPAMTTGTLATVDRSRSGIASAVLNTTRQTAGAIGVAVFGAMATGGPAAIVQAIITSSVSSAVYIAVYLPCVEVPKE